MFTPEKLNEIRCLAENGDANAQYALAASLSQTGARDESRRWLEKSAAQNHADALYTLATLKFDAFDALPSAVDLLRRAAAQKNLAAMRQLAALLVAGAGVEQNKAETNKLLLSAAKGGDHAAMREIAGALIMNDHDDINASPILRAAAERDGAAAATYIARAVEGRPNTDLETTRALLSKLERARYPHATYLSEKLLSSSSQPAATSEIEWRAVEDCLGQERSREIIGEELCSKPTVKIFRSVIPAEICEYVIAHTTRLLAPAKIVDPVTGQSRPDSIRRSFTATIGLVDVDTVIARINDRVAGLLGRPCDHGEFLSILHYQPGQEYKRHYDWLPETDDVAENGQRAATALLCLNDDYDGGETYFVTPDLRIRGETGDVIVFENVTPDGAIDRDSQHAGLPVKNGAKWIASRWFRERKYRF